MNSNALDRILQEKIVAIIRIPNAVNLRNTVQALIDGGITCIEVTMTVHDAIQGIAMLRKEFGDTITLGAGTVLDSESVDSIAAVGGEFIVSPVLLLEVVQRTKYHGLLAISGCFTPTEVHSGWRAGADIVKVFPASAMGMKYLKDLGGPFPDVKLMPTGGVTIENARDWLKNGASAVGIGTDLVSRKLVDEERFDEITQRARQLVESVTNIQ